MDGASGNGGVTGEEWWREWLLWILQNPWDFVYYLFLILTPLFVISMVISWKLSKNYQAQHAKDKKRGGKKSTPSSSSKARASGRTLRSNANKTD